MKCVLVTPPTIEPIDLASLKLHLRLDSGSFADNIDETPSFHPASYAVHDDWISNVGDPVEVLGYTAVVEFSAGTNLPMGTVDMRIQDADVIGTWAPWGTGFTQITAEGILTGAMLAIGTDLTHVANSAFTFYVAGVNYPGMVNPVGTDPGSDLIPQGKYGAVAFDVGTDYTIHAIPATGNAGGYANAAAAIAGIPAVLASHARMGTVTVVSTAVAGFQFGIDALNLGTATVVYTSAVAGAMVPDNTTYEKAYTGTKRYIRTVAKVLRAACTFGTSVIRLTATSIEDDLLNSIITSAREHVEDITRRQLLTATWDYFLDDWPKEDFIKIPFGNLQNAGFVWKDTDGHITILTLTDDYLVETNGDQCGRIVLPYGGIWPTGTLYPSNPITIRFVCGWTTAALVPSKIKSACKLIATKLYESRGEEVLGQTVSEDKTVDRLLSSVTLWEEFQCGG